MTHYEYRPSVRILPGDDDDEENEEIMRANADIVHNPRRHEMKNTHYNSSSNSHMHGDGNNSNRHGHGNSHSRNSAGSTSTNSNSHTSSNRNLIQNANSHNGNKNNNTNGNNQPRNFPDNSRSASDNWKGIGNRHMANQEYEEAYKAYSAALSISPLGTSSHIYLSNRAAALLSLKRYSAASVDARRAITLAPTFGKAHARLGQSLYFLKDYAGAVAAYENAFQFEPDNQVTWTYLNKAKKKFARENERKRRKEEEQIDLINKKVLEKEKERDLLKLKLQQQKQQQYEQQQRYRQEEENDLTQDEPIYEEDEPLFEEEDATVDGASVTDSVNLANMAISVIGDNATTKEKGVSVLSTHDEGDDIDQLVAAVDRGETSIVRGKLQAALDSTSPSGGRGQNDNTNHDDSNNNLDNTYDYDDDGIEDPDFDEALRLQEVASIKLVNKEYRHAVEEFSAALFLVPDDTNLTPQLYVGRAHALNGLNRHEGALNDSMMALGRNPELPEAHVVLARTYFYVKNFSGAVLSFETAKQILKKRKQGDKLSPLDELYYEKAIENSKYQPDGDDSDGKSYRSLALPSDKPIPKLKPPRFVSRQELIESTTNVPRMSKSLANQIPTLFTALQVSEERNVVILSDTLGITLNRGQDGIIRTLSVAPEVPGAKYARRGEILIGDVIREAAGIDLRRPLTNVMWSDTVAHMKMSPRPLHIVVAQELSRRPASVQEEFTKLSINTTTKRRQMQDPPSRSRDPPSRASGSEAVRVAISETEDMERELTANSNPMGNDGILNNHSNVSASLLDAELSDEDLTQQDDQIDEKSMIESVLGVENEPQSIKAAEGKESVVNRSRLRSLSDELDNLGIESMVSDNVVEDDEKVELRLKVEKEVSNDTNSPVRKIEPLVSNHAKPPAVKDAEPICSPICGLQKGSSERIEILKSVLDKDFIFITVDSASPSYEQTKAYTNTKWLAESSSRELIVCGDVFLFEKGNYFWQSNQFVPRTLAVYSDLLVIGREPQNAAEIRSSCNDPGQPDVFAGMPDEDLMGSFLVAEIIIDLKTCKLRRSLITTPSSVESVDIDEATKQDEPELRQKCFEIVTPTQNYLISSVGANEEIVNTEGNDKLLFLTTQWEVSIKDALISVHAALRPFNDGDKSWVHQIILGTLHSHVVSGNYNLLEKAVMGNKEKQISPYPGIDDVDDDGLTTLHHACFRRSSTAVTVILNAGANCSKATSKGRKTPCHISAEQLDAKSLSMILSQSQPSRPDPNALDEDGYTPMTSAVLKGRAPGGNRSPTSLNMCIASLQAWGGRLHVPYSPHPISSLSAECCHEELDIIFPICDCEFPVTGNGIDGYGQSLGALFDYPIHACLIKLREKVAQISESSRVFPRQVSLDRPAIVRTLEALLNTGFEPNERIEKVNKGMDPLNEMIGYTPLQILAAAALDILHLSSMLKRAHHPDIKAATALISSCSEMLVSKGGRTSIDPPTPLRFHDDKKAPTKSSSSEEHVTTILRIINRTELIMEKNQDVMKILDCNQNLVACRSKWQQTKLVKAFGSNTNSFLNGKGLSMKLEDSNLIGGSYERNCAICWKKFGQLRNRKHICRASRRYVCDECSTNSVLVDGDARRVSDGQFNLITCRLERKEEQDRAQYENKKVERRTRIEKAWTASHSRKNTLQETQKDETAAKEELFGSVGRAMKSFFMEEVEEPPSREADTNERVSGVMSTLSQTGDAFRERGEKLNTLVEKTGALKNASEDFAKMARELKESQQKGLFW